MMTQEIKERGETVAEMFLDTMPEDVFKRYSKEKLHHQLAFFFCWCEVMQQQQED